MALYMAAVSIGLSTIRGAASLFLSDKHNKYSAFILTLIIVCLIAIEISHYADILILLAAVAIGLSAHFRDDCCHVSYDNNHLSSVVDYSFFDIWGI